MADDSCRNCYAPRDAAGLQTSRGVELYAGTTVYRGGRWTWSGLLTERLPEDPTWKALLNLSGVPDPLLGKGKPSLIWLNSMADIFVPGRRIEVIDRIFQTVSFTRNNIIGMVLTKYPEQLVAYFSQKPDWWKQKIWLGFSAGDQRWFDHRWAILRPLAEQGWFVFVSIQPMLAPVVLPPDSLKLIKWVICGGEQSPGKRVMDPNWARSLHGQCVGADPPLPFFCKQMTRLWRPPDLLFQDRPKV